MDTKRTLGRGAIGAALALCVLLVGAGRASATVNIAIVPVGDAGNAADTTGYGSVAYTYNIGKYDVTLGQYAAFLNAVAKTDTYGLYTPSMANDYPTFGIQQGGSSGSYSYSVTGGYSQGANCPIPGVNWGDAARFCNWLTNGQPSGPEGKGTTETGLYALNGATTRAALMAITRNAGAGYAIPTEIEWYKAAYYDPTLNSGAGGYWQYPTRSNTAPDNTLANAATDPNDANYYISAYTDPTNYLTPVGTFAASPSAYGTFDQGGDVYQWNEANINGLSRGTRGGASFLDLSLQSGSCNYYYPTDEYSYIGFRVSQVPEPASLLILGLGVAGLLARRRMRVPQP